MSEGPLAELADEELVRRVAVGDEMALTILYRRHVAAIYRFILAQVRAVQDAEDLTSDTFARMLRSLAAFRGEASFRNWLYQIARNGVRNHRRSASYRLTVPLPPTLSVPLRTELEPSSANEAAAAALAVLQPLPPRYRQVLELRFLEGRSIEDTATHMGISVSNAKVLQHRALRKAAMLSPMGREIDAERARS